MTPLYQVDAFADGPFTGNPAAVCLLDAPAEEAWMQHVAAEMNLSETAFLVPGAEAYTLRWFTPASEVDLCGHATLASAHVLYETGRVALGDEARFDTASGRLTVKKTGDALAMDFPATPPRLAEPPAGVAGALDATPTWAGRTRFDLFLEMGDEATVRSLAPDFAALRALGVRGLIATACADDGQGYDFVSRFFAPGVGIDEDPVTGSAHCALAPYWSERLGSDVLTGYQASARGGMVRVESHGDRVVLTGRAVTVLRGELAV